ncbi:MAG: hypothetical protein WC975_07360 [Phycisphaerae bacterium]
MRLFFCLIVILSGCVGPMRTVAQMGLTNRELASAAETAVKQEAGRDVFNVSPNLAISGGGGVIFLIFCTLLMKWFKSKRTLKTVVSAIEGLEGSVSGDVKHRISRKALEVGVADYLHGVVKVNKKTDKT